jgi:Cys-rich repeat protein
MRTALSLFLALSLSIGLAGCATYREDLNRGQRMYEENQYENALAIWRVLEDDSDSLSLNDQARYAYLRGMTDYRLAFRADSRHWLAIAKATEEAYPGGLSVEWKERLEQSLTDLNQDVYGGGERFDNSNSVAIETTTPAPGAGAPAANPAALPVTPPRRPGGCTSNADCPTGQICDGKSCVPL